MRKITRRSFLTASSLLAATAAGSLLVGCGSSSSVSQTAAASSTASAAKAGEHAPITIMDANRDYSALMDLVHQKYPEIELQVQPYRGHNTTVYMKKQLSTDHQPDIYNTTQVWDDALQKEHLLDLSAYAVTELYNPARLNEVDVEGATYLLPYDFSIQGITCNRSLLERLGLAVPTSFAQLRNDVVPALQAAGVNISDCMMNLPGYSFQYFFNSASTGFVNTLEGRQWQHDFLHNADITAADHLQSCRDTFQQWIDCGLLNSAHAADANKDLHAHFIEGNTAFMLNPIYTQSEEDIGDAYVLLPYTSRRMAARTCTSPSPAVTTA